MKRAIAMFLVFILSLSGIIEMCGTAYADAQPVVVERTDTYTIWQNADGSRTIRMEYAADELIDPSQVESWLDQGESWTNMGAVAQTELQKTYDENGMLVTLRRNGTSISFAPSCWKRKPARRRLT